MTIPTGALLFADSNVLIESLFIPASPASLVIKIVSAGAFEIATCQPVVRDVEKAILNKLSSRTDRLDIVLEQWQDLQKRTRLKIFPVPPSEVVTQTYNDYIASMRHKADIEVLAAALVAQPAAILSANRGHFNDVVAHKCGIPIFSCVEFLEMLTV